MSKTNREYWRERQVQAMLRSEKNTKRVHQEMKEAYQKAADSINDEIAKFFARFSKSGKVPAVELFRILTEKETAKWKMSLKEYMEQIAALEDSYPEQAKALKMELEFFSARTRINRLEAFKSQITMQMTTLARVEDDKVREHLVKEYQQSYYTAMYDFYKDSNPKVLALMEASKVRIDPIMIYDTLSLPWSGSNYSERIWKRQYDVAKHLKRMISNHLLTGASIQRMTKDVTAELGKDYKYAAERLLRTETAWVHGQADKAIYERLEVEEYEFIATLDVKTSSICRSLDLKRFKVSEAVVGKNYPPMHPNCRSTTGIYDPTWNDGTRIAKGADGKSYSVPSNMNYEEWYKKYINDGKDPIFAHPVISDEKDKIRFMSPVADVEVYKVAGINLDMWVEGKDGNKQVRLNYRLCREIEKMLPESMEMPRIAIVDFEKYGAYTQIAGYAHYNNTLYLNKKFTTRESVRKIMKENKGYFARADEQGMILHELGHKYHHELIERIAKYQNVSYDRAKERLEYPIVRAVKKLYKSNHEKLRTEFSGYAIERFENELRLGKGKEIREVMAEYFAIRDKNIEIVSFIREHIRSLLGGGE